MRLSDAAGLDAVSAGEVVYVIRGRPGPNDRPALPAGHPESWGAITRGTVLDGAAYPHQVFVGGAKLAT